MPPTRPARPAQELPETASGRRPGPLNLPARPNPFNEPAEGSVSFTLLNDPTTDVQLLIRNDEVSVVEVKKEDQSVTVHLVGGQTLHLTHEQSKQYVHHIKAHMHPAP